MDIDSIRRIRFPKDLFIHLAFLFLLMPSFVLARQYPQAKDSSKKRTFLTNPNYYITFNYAHPYKGGFTTKLDPENFIYGTNFIHFTSGFQAHIGIPIIKYLGISGQISDMSVEPYIPEYVPPTKAHNVYFVYYPYKYSLTSNSAGLFLTLPTKFFSIEIEGDIGAMTFSTPECAMWLNESYDKDENTYTGIVHRDGHSYTGKIYSYSLQGRYSINKNITLSIRYSKYIIPGLIATSTNFDTRVPGYSIVSTPNISFNYESISIGIGFQIDRFHLNNHE